MSNTPNLKLQRCRPRAPEARRDPPEVGRFNAQEIAALKDKDDLVAQVQTKYQSTRARRKAMSMPSRKVGSFNRA